MSDNYADNSYAIMRYERAKEDLAEVGMFVRCNGSSITVENNSGSTVYFICYDIAELAGWAAAATKFADRSLKQYVKEQATRQ
jgi:hypothetical protein